MQPKILYEDQPAAGLVLVPPSAPEYDALLEDIRTRNLQMAERYPGPFGETTAKAIAPEQRATSAILLNKRSKTLALAQILWRCVRIEGPPFNESIGWIGQRRLLLHFGELTPIQKIFGYWFTVLPGSKRYLAKNLIVGDNSDVRPPNADEIWNGGWTQGSGGPGFQSNVRLRSMTISIDAAFFLDGEFVGPNRSQLFEEITAEASAHRKVGVLASEPGDPVDVLSAIKRLTGPATVTSVRSRPHASASTSQSEYEEYALQTIAQQIARMRSWSSDEQIVQTLRHAKDARLPDFRKRT